MRSNEIRRILTESKTIAVVGLSRESRKESYQVAEYLKKHGYRIVPVNPFADKILAEKSYQSLLDIPVALQKEIDIVDVFRRSEDVLLVVEQAVKLKKQHGKPCVVWMQLGIVNDKAAAAAEKAGLTIVMDRCIMQEHNVMLLQKQKARRFSARFPNASNRFTRAREHTRRFPSLWFAGLARVPDSLAMLFSHRSHRFILQIN